MVESFVDFPGIGLPDDEPLETTLTGQYFQALDNFYKTFAIRGDDRMVFLSDKKLDPRVVHAICGVARARGVKPTVVTIDSGTVLTIPDDVKPILEKATFVVSTWYCSVIDPFCIALRKKGQRWVKITFFRNLDLLKTAQARFPIEIVGELIRQTAARFPVGVDFDLAFSDPRGTDLRISYTPEMRENLLSPARWRGQMTADEPGAYVHYLQTHGPNLYDRSAVGNDDAAVVPMTGVVYPFWAVGFAKPFEERIGVHFEGDRISKVTGSSKEAGILRDMLVGGQLIELGCGFNPKAPRYRIYPAGSNSPGAIHYGIDLVKPSDYVRRMMPEWEEPPVHADLIAFDTTVTAGNQCLVKDGFLEALRDPEVVEMAERYGDPVDLLESWPN